MRASRVRRLWASVARSRRGYGAEVGGGAVIHGPCAAQFFKTHHLHAAPGALGHGPELSRQRTALAGRPATWATKPRNHTPA